MNNQTFTFISISDQSKPKRNLTQQLIGKGLLTPEMLKQLQLEWQKDKTKVDKDKK